MDPDLHGTNVIEISLQVHTNFSRKYLIDFTLIHSGHLSRNIHCKSTYRNKTIRYLPTEPPVGRFLRYLTEVTYRTKVSENITVFFLMERPFSVYFFES